MKYVDHRQRFKRLVTWSAVSAVLSPNVSSSKSSGWINSSPLSIGNIREKGLNVKTYHEFIRSEFHALDGLNKMLRISNEFLYFDKCSNHAFHLPLGYLYTLMKATVW